MITRRHFLALMAAPALTGLYTWRIEPTWEEYVRLRLPIRDLPPALAGRSLVQLSDLHVGDRVSSDYLAGVFATVKQINPDIVA